MPFEGSVIGIDPKVDPATRLVAVRAELANPQGLLSPGQYVQVRVELPSEKDVIALPQTALVTSLYGDYIYVVRPAGEPAEQAGEAVGQEGQETPETAADGKPPVLTARQVFIKPGRRNQGRIEVTEGVKAGDEVVTAGQNRLSNGAVVVVDNTIDPTTRGTQAAMLP